MTPSNMYSKVGILTPEARVSKFTAGIILAVFAGLMYFAFSKYMPEIQARNQAAAAEAAAVAPRAHP